MERPANRPDAARRGRRHGPSGKNADKYSNTEAAKTFLVKTSPDYIGHASSTTTTSSRLGQSFPRLSSQENREKETKNEGRTRKLSHGMYNNASSLAPRITREIDLSQRRHLLDWWRPRTYAIHFVRPTPTQATVFDLPTTEPFARKTIRRFGLSSRLIPGRDYLCDTVQGTYDVAWLSQFFTAWARKAASRSSKRPCRS